MVERQRIVIPGGSGFLGRLLCDHFKERFDVVVLRRGPEACTVRAAPPLAGAHPAVTHLLWDSRTLGPWREVVDGATAVINLTGRSVDCRYSEANRRAILESRVNSTEVVGRAIAAAEHPPAVWLNASSATIYSASWDTDRTEDSDTDATGFSEEVCHRWEAELEAADTPHTRKVALRISIAFSPEPGGAVDIIHRLVRFGLGGSQGSGRQMVSWIHSDDFVAAVEWILEHRELRGPINLAAPNPLTNAQFMRDFRRAARVPFGLPAPGPVLRLGAVLLRTEPELVLKSRRVVPQRLLDSGFEFQHPTWASAIADILDRRRSRAKRDAALPPTSTPASAEDRHSSTGS